MQDWEEAANVQGNSYKWNRNILSLFLNVASMMSSVLSSAGRLFHTRGHTLDSKAAVAIVCSGA